MRQWFREVPRKVVFVSSPTSSADEGDTLDYFASIISDLALAIQISYPSYDFVVRVPSGPANEASDRQAAFVQAAIDGPFKPECIVVSPVDITLLYPDRLKAWDCYRKLVFFDQGFPLTSYEHYIDEECARPPYIQADWVQGGKVAGESMKSLLLSKKLMGPNVVVVGGLVGSEERIRGFKEAMGAAVPAAGWPVSYLELHGGYTKEGAFEAFEPLLKERIRTKSPIDGVFATNDEMSLGIREALVKHKADYITAVGPLPDDSRPRLPVVIGFDGIRDLTLLIDHDDEFIYDTVCVRLTDQIAELSRIVKLVIAGRPMHSEDKYIDMKCVSYRKSKDMPV